MSAPGGHLGQQRVLSLTDGSQKIIDYSLEMARVNAVQRRIKAADTGEVDQCSHWTVRISQIDQALAEIRA
jgi:hypothetical protein